MNKEELKDIYQTMLREEGLTSQDVLVVSGGAMVLHGLRESTSDVDTVLNKDVFYRLTDKVMTPVENHPQYGVRSIYNKDVDIHISDTDTLEGVIVEGVLTQSLEQILDFKLWLNRPKDQDDIKALKKALGL